MGLGLLLPATAGASQGDPLRVAFPAFAATKLAPNEREIGGQLIILQGGCGGERAYTVPVVRYTAVKDAIGYRALIGDTVTGDRFVGGPPFDDDSKYGAAPAGTHQHELAGLFTPGRDDKCAEAEAYYRGRLTILSVVAIFKPDDTPRIVGTVRKANGAGRAGVRVTAAGTKTVSAKTDATGYYSMRVRKGRYAVSARPHCVVGAAGCKQSKTVRVTSGAQQVDFGPRPKVTLSGRVVERQCDRLVCTSPAGLEGAGVVASSTGGEDAALAQTGPGGSWSVEVPAGGWKVAAAHEGRSFRPPVRRVQAERDVGDLDFESCQFIGGQAGSSCDPDGLDWSMPERLTEAAAKKHFKDIGLPTRTYLDPPTWEMELFVTKEGEPMPSACLEGDDVRWRWVVRPRNRKATVVGEVPDGCRTLAEVSHLGDYSVTAVKDRRTDGDWEEELRLGPVKVTLDDVILAGVGDSSASGEGNSPFYFGKCDRSVVAYQFQAALFVEQQDPHTSVTFLHPACSGARLDHMWKRRYKGTHRNTHLPPQLDQIAQRLTRPGLRRDPEVDAAIAGVGVNDIAFGPVIVHCLWSYPVGLDNIGCPDDTVTAVLDADGFVEKFELDPDGHYLSEWVDGFMRALRPKYAAFIKRVRAEPEDGGLGLVKRARVLLTQYPNPGRNKDGVCDTRDNLSPPHWPPRTWGWLGDTAERVSAVIRGSSALGYTPVPMDQSMFYPHGYCVYDGTSWFVGIFQAAKKLNFKGGFHPNAFAHAAIAAETRAKLCEALYGNPMCKGEFRG